MSRLKGIDAGLFRIGCEHVVVLTYGDSTENRVRSLHDPSMYYIQV